MKPTLTKMNPQFKTLQVGRPVNLVVALQLLLWTLLETMFHFRRTNPLAIDLDAIIPLRFKLPTQNLLGAVVVVVIAARLANRFLSTLFSRSFCSLVDKKGEM